MTCRHSASLSSPTFRLDKLFSGLPKDSEDANYGSYHARTSGTSQRITTFTRQAHNRTTSTSEAQSGPTATSKSQDETTFTDQQDRRQHDAHHICICSSERHYWQFHGFQTYQRGEGAVATRTRRRTTTLDSRTTNCFSVTSFFTVVSIVRLLMAGWQLSRGASRRGNDRFFRSIRRIHGRL